MQFFTAIQQKCRYKINVSPIRNKPRPTKILAIIFEFPYIFETYNIFSLQMFHLIVLRAIYVLCTQTTPWNVQRVIDIYMSEEHDIEVVNSASKQV